MSNHPFRSMQIVVLILVLAGLVQPASISAQDAPPASTPAAPPSLQEQLEAQYPLAKMTASGGCTVTNPETVVVLQKKGIVALPQKWSNATCASRYRNGSITKPGFMCNSLLSMSKQTLTTLEQGDKVFPTKIEVSRDNVKIAFGYCSGDAGQAAAYAGQVLVEFPKDSLKTASVSQVEDKIAEVFALGSGDQGNASQPPPAANQAAPAEQAPSVEVGQTTEQVISVLGEPDTKAKGAGTKLICFWNSRKLKVTFVDGKVADVE